MTDENADGGEFVEVAEKGDGAWTRIEHRDHKEAEAGFDLTRFESAEDFEALLERHDLADGFAKVNDPKSSRDPCPTWSNENVLLIAKSNPITGVSADPADPGIDKGYASYIGIQGTEDAVDGLYKDIRETAEFIDGGGNPEVRGFI